MKTTIGQRVKMLRTHLKLNPQQFAGDTNMTVSTLYRIENDEVEPRSKTISDIQRAYGVDSDWLVDGRGEMKFTPVKPDSKSTFDPARDTLYKELKEQIAFYRNLLQQMAGGKGNFLRALNGTGLHKRRSLRAAA
jgi:transcriptional regulator with XRE-family HTH domain